MEDFAKICKKPPKKPSYKMFLQYLQVEGKYKQPEILLSLFYTTV